MDRTVYEKSSTCILMPQQGLIIAAFEVDEAAKSADLSGLFALSHATTGFLPTSPREEK
jgi:hypothetical protein